MERWRENDSLKNVWVRDSSWVLSEWIPNAMETLCIHRALQRALWGSGACPLFHSSDARDTHSLKQHGGKHCLACTLHQMHFTLTCWRGPGPPKACCTKSGWHAEWRLLQTHHINELWQLSLLFQLTFIDGHQTKAPEAHMVVWCFCPKILNLQQRWNVLDKEGSCSGSVHTLWSFSNPQWPWSEFSKSHNTHALSISNLLLTPLLPPSGFPFASSSSSPVISFSLQGEMVPLFVHVDHPFRRFLARSDLMTEREAEKEHTFQVDYVALCGHVTLNWQLNRMHILPFLIILMFFFLLPLWEPRCTGYHF